MGDDVCQGMGHWAWMNSSRRRHADKEIYLTWMDLLHIQLAIMLTVMSLSQMETKTKTGLSQLWTMRVNKRVSATLRGNEQQHGTTCRETKLSNMNGLAAYSARHYVNSYEFVADGNKNESLSLSQLWMMWVDKGVSVISRVNEWKQWTTCRETKQMVMEDGDSSSH